MRFIDSNVFIYHLAADKKYGKRSRQILTSIERGAEAVTSTLPVVQACSYLRWKRADAVIPVFLALVRRLLSLQKFETTFLDFEEAASIQAESKLPWRMWDDLVIAAQMRRLGIGEIYSNDTDFDRMPGIKRLF